MASRHTSSANIIDNLHGIKCWWEFRNKYYRLMRIKLNSNPSDMLKMTGWCWVTSYNQDMTWTVLLHQSNQLCSIEKDEGQLQNPMCDQSQVTHLWLFDTALLERAVARIIGARVAIFAPVALVWASNTGQTPGIGNGCGLMQFECS